MPLLAKSSTLVAKRVIFADTLAAVLATTDAPPVKKKAVS